MDNYAPEVKKILKRAGCEPEKKRGRGSHEKWWSPVTHTTFTVPDKIKSKHTANGCLKDAGLDKAF